VAKFIRLGVNINDVYVSLIDPAFEEDFIRAPLKDEQCDFTDGVKIWVASVDVPIFQF
jgi:hypothetical protein